MLGTTTNGRTVAGAAWVEWDDKALAAYQAMIEHLVDTAHRLQLTSGTGTGLRGPSCQMTVRTVRLTLVHGRTVTQFGTINPGDPRWINSHPGQDTTLRVYGAQVVPLISSRRTVCPMGPQGSMTPTDPCDVVLGKPVGRPGTRCLMWTVISRSVEQAVPPFPNTSRVLVFGPADGATVTRPARSRAAWDVCRER